jgi:hypothetical protein
MELPVPVSSPSLSEPRPPWSWRRCVSFLRKLDASAPSDSSNNELESRAEYSSSSGRFTRRPGPATTTASPKPDHDDCSPVDEVVVDNVFFESTHSLALSSLEKGGGPSGGGGGGGSSHGSTSSSTRDGGYSHSSFWERTRVGYMLRWRGWPACYHFFDSSFDNAASEATYLKEQWYTNKRLALFTSWFFIVNQILAIITLHRPWTHQ